MSWGMSSFFGNTANASDPANETYSTEKPAGELVPDGDNVQYDEPHGNVKLLVVSVITVLLLGISIGGQAWGFSQLSKPFASGSLEMSSCVSCGLKELGGAALDALNDAKDDATSAMAGAATTAAAAVTNAAKDAGNAIQGAFGFKREVRRAARDLAIRAMAEALEPTPAPTPVRRHVDARATPAPPPPLPLHHLERRDASGKWDYAISFKGDGKIELPEVLRPVLEDFQKWMAYLVKAFYACELAAPVQDGTLTACKRRSSLPYACCSGSP
jgi:hypothetical protein